MTILSSKAWICRNLALFFSLLIFVTVSCAQSVADLLSLRPSKPEPVAFQLSKLKKWNVRPDVVAVFDSTCLDSMKVVRYALDTQMLRYASFSPIQFRVYENDGSLYTAWQYCFGNIRILGTIKDNSFQDIPRLPINRNLDFAHDSSLFLPVSGSVPDISQYSRVVVAFWDPYFGRSVRKMLQLIQKVIDADKSSKTLFITVNYNGLLAVEPQL
ncbi:MAG: hypothetical protein J5792_00455 [Bacteroidales bacterium]|nr:hypothetical protein [Bacteroidales bacterium]